MSHPFLSSGFVSAEDDIPLRGNLAKMPVSSSGNAPLERLARMLEQESADGAALVRDIGNNPICRISYDESIPGLFVEWRNYATSIQLRFIHERILQLLEQHRVAKILADTSELPTVHAEDQKWIIEDWVPRAKAAGLRAAASNRPTAYFGRLAVNSLHSAMTMDIVVRSFDRLDEARRWLETVAV